jgi:hypothetical protein
MRSSASLYTRGEPAASGQAHVPGLATFPTCRRRNALKQIEPAQVSQAQLLLVLRDGRPSRSRRSKRTRQGWWQAWRSAARRSPGWSGSAHLHAEEADRRLLAEECPQKTGLPLHPSQGNNGGKESRHSCRRASGRDECPRYCLPALWIFLRGRSPRRVPELLREGHRAEPCRGTGRPAWRICPSSIAAPQPRRSPGPVASFSAFARSTGSTTIAGHKASDST